MKKLPSSWDALTRRHFLYLSAGVFLTGCPDAPKTAVPPGPLPSPPAPVPSTAAAVASRHGTVIGPGRFMKNNEMKFVLSIVNLDSAPRSPRTIPLTFFAHGVVPNPVAPAKAVLFEKKGKGSCEVDLVSGTVLRAIPTLEERQFYGHGDYLPDGSVLFATETVTHGRYEGVIAVRDGKTLELKDTFPSHGSSPHDCRLIDGGRVMVVANGGGPMDSPDPPNVTYVDVKTGSLLEKVEFPDLTINAGHFALSAAGDLAVVSAPREGQPDYKNRPGGITVKPVGKKPVTLAEPREVTSRLMGEVLSVCVHEPTNVVAAPPPLGDVVTFWNVKTCELVKKLDLPRARGVSLTLDGKHFVITHGDVDVTLVTTNGLEPVPAERFTGSLLTGSHIITYSL